MNILDVSLLMETAAATGDTFNAKPLIILMVCAVAVAVGSVIFGKNKKDKK